jgi:hypothetical protein
LCVFRAPLHKKEKFEKDFDEVIVKDEPKDKIATDNINVVEPVKLKHLKRFLLKRMM